jgi:hypothetical protein
MELCDKTGSLGPQFGQRIAFARRAFGCRHSRTLSSIGSDPDKFTLSVICVLVDNAKRFYFLLRAIQASPAIRRDVGPNC